MNDSKIWIRIASMSNGLSIRGAGYDECTEDEFTIGDTIIDTESKEWEKKSDADRLTIVANCLLEYAHNSTKEKITESLSPQIDDQCKCIINDIIDLIKKLHTTQQSSRVCYGILMSFYNTLQQMDELRYLYNKDQK